MEMVLAQTAGSTNYTNIAIIDKGGGTGASVSYSQRGSVGQNSVGETTSATYRNQSFAGYLFEAIPKISVIVDTNPANLEITVDGVSYKAPQTFSWLPGSSHTIGVDSPQSGGDNKQFVWTGWSDGGLQTHEVIPLTNIAYTASFKTQYLLTISINPGGSGYVWIDPPGESITEGSRWYDQNTSVKLQANPQGGWDFSYWSGNLTGSANPAYLTMDAPKSVTAFFSAKKTGGGGGGCGSVGLDIILLLSVPWAIVRICKWITLKTVR
jgi:hypothetical protein